MIFSCLFKTLPAPVGASLLAIAVYQSPSLLNVTASSRAGSLPQLIGVGLRYGSHHAHWPQTDPPAAHACAPATDKPRPSASARTPSRPTGNTAPTRGCR